MFFWTPRFVHEKYYDLIWFFIIIENSIIEKYDSGCAKLMSNPFLTAIVCIFIMFTIYAIGITVYIYEYEKVI